MVLVLPNGVSRSFCSLWKFWSKKGASLGNIPCCSEKCSVAAPFFLVKRITVFRSVTSGASQLCASDLLSPCLVICFPEEWLASIAAGLFPICVLGFLRGALLLSLSSSFSRRRPTQSVPSLIQRKNLFLPPSPVAALCFSSLTDRRISARSASSLPEPCVLCTIWHIFWKLTVGRRQKSTLRDWEIWGIGGLGAHPPNPQYKRSINEV